MGAIIAMAERQAVRHRKFDLFVMIQVPDDSGTASIRKNRMIIDQLEKTIGINVNMQPHLRWQFHRTNPAT